MRGLNRKRLLKIHPYCIYCGGEEPATTVDHMPNKGMFPNSHRPQGLEFPCCEKCNSGTTWAEDIAAFLGSIQYVDTEKTTSHFETKFRHLQKNDPQVIKDMWAKSGAAPNGFVYVDEGGEELGMVDVQSPKISKVMLIYGAKLGLALHWDVSKKILPKNGRVGVLWYTNFNALNNEVPQQLFELLPEIDTLRQGKNHVLDMFAYSSRTTTDGSSTAHWATFGNAFVYLLFVSETLKMDILPSDQLFHPGCFSSSKPKFDTIFSTNSTWMPYSG